MALMMGKLYAALRVANVPDDTAREAAEEIAGYENHFGKIENELTAIRGQVGLLKWMAGANTAMILAVLGIVLQLLRHPIS